eukprot:638049-Hanusia_phi.AAC.1
METITFLPGAVLYLRMPQANENTVKDIRQKVSKVEVMLVVNDVMSSMTWNRSSSFSYFQELSVVTMIKQNLDVANSLIQCSPNVDFVLLWEDDSLMCPLSFDIINELLVNDTCRESSRWTIADLSYGLNGKLLLQSVAIDFSSYLRSMAKFYPCDFLIWDNFTSVVASDHGTTRCRNFNYDPHLVSKYHLAHHRGTESTLSRRTRINIPTCFNRHQNYEAERLYSVVLPFTNNVPAGNNKARYLMSFMGHSYDEGSQCQVVH